LSSAAIGAGRCAARRQTVRHPFDLVAIDRRLTRRVGVQGLRHEQRQGNGWRVQPLPVRGRMLIDDTKQLRRGQKIGKLVPVKRLCLRFERGLLMQARSTITVHRS